MSTRVAFLFPGQGSQTVGMGADIYEASPAARRVFEAADTALGFPLSSLCFQGPEDTLRSTINAQPAIVTVSLAFLAALQEALSPDDSSWISPLTPAFLAGHSVGEWTELTAASVLSLEETIKGVRERGRLMEQEGTSCPGGMAAIIAMEPDVVEQVCQEATERALAEISEPVHPGQGKVIAANYNAPGQIVISGEKRALELACELAKARGAKRVIPLAVSGAFHSPVMRPAADALDSVLSELQIKDAVIPIISNISATPLTDAHALREELAKQVASSVQWTKTVEYLVSAGVTTFIEIGPGNALAGMVKRIAKGVTMLNVSKASDVAKVAAALREAGI
ncbi:[acyl-carrier-protein] S-malonyltransferase [Thermosporothrix hazakensis]|uniref:Malonyl CoA-acyl carrier protein transacylase n=1 Tax=Thermosporothrix hazakensis TaxID=644383 RepID=A0A326URP5_THEHA|nr:ACP S-malonyltransferase [Thermosporothrix hazakensis]PZW36599.1 [acyl-carrier-protein] S-malonyltransferase [Thermosporothrix hazakensis]GCE47250.1 malonyl CoA-acyl carrier protein transacylase [Thermosporothrix hazakensis]